MLFLERILYYLESWFQETVTIILWYYLIYILSYEIINFSTQLQPYRRKRNDNMNIISKKITKVLMGKNEILQTNNISRELHSIIDWYKIDESINKDMWLKRTFMNRNSDFWLGLLVVGTYYILWNLYFTGDIQLHIIVWFWGAFVLMQRSIWEALSFYI